MTGLVTCIVLMLVYMAMSAIFFLEVAAPRRPGEQLAERTEPAAPKPPPSAVAEAIARDQWCVVMRFDAGPVRLQAMQLPWAYNRCARLRGHNVPVELHPATPTVLAMPLLDGHKEELWWCSPADVVGPYEAAPSGN